MTIYAVFVSCTAPGYYSRWIDTQWAVREKAEERSRELDRIHAGFAVGHHKTYVVEMSIVDAVIAPPTEAEGSNP